MSFSVSLFLTLIKDCLLFEAACRQGISSLGNPSAGTTYLLCRLNGKFYQPPPDLVHGSVSAEWLNHGASVIWEANCLPRNLGHPYCAQHLQRLSEAWNATHAQSSSLVVSSQIWSINYPLQGTAFHSVLIPLHSVATIKLTRAEQSLLLAPTCSSSNRQITRELYVSLYGGFLVLIPFFFYLFIFLK